MGRASHQPQAGLSALPGGRTGRPATPTHACRPDAGAGAGDCPGAQRQLDAGCHERCPRVGRRIRVLSVLDCCTREALAIEVNTSLPSAAVIRALEQVIDERGQPGEIVMDNGPELTSRQLDQWACERGTRFIFRPNTSPARTSSTSPSPSLARGHGGSTGKPSSARPAACAPKHDATSCLWNARVGSGMLRGVGWMTAGGAA